MLNEYGFNYQTSRRSAVNPSDGTNALNAPESDNAPGAISSAQNTADGSNRALLFPALFLFVSLFANVYRFATSQLR